MVKADSSNWQNKQGQGEGCRLLKGYYIIPNRSKISWIHGKVPLFVQ